MFSKLRSLIFKVDPEKAHTLAIKSLKFNLVPNVFDENKNDPIFQTKIFDKDLDNPIGMAVLRLIEIIGQDKISDLGSETLYFLINALNQMNIDPLRNEILFNVLPLRA